MDGIFFRSPSLLRDLIKSITRFFSAQTTSRPQGFVVGFGDSEENPLGKLCFDVLEELNSLLDLNGESPIIHQFIDKKSLQKLWQNNG